MPAAWLLNTLRLTLTPALIGLAYLAGRRLGPRVSGVIGSMPFVAGPILGLYAAENPALARVAAQSTWLATIPLCGYCLVYAWSCRLCLRLFGNQLGTRKQRRSLCIGLCLGLSWLSFLGFATLLSPLRLELEPRLGSLGFIVAILGLQTALLAWLLKGGQPTLPSDGGEEAPLPGGPLPLLTRVIAGAVLVASVSFAAPWLGPRWTGILATFPVLGSVLVVFTHHEQGPPAAGRVLTGYLRGMPALILFCLTLHLSLGRLGLWTSFGLATGLCAAAHTAMALLGRRRRAT